VAYLREMLKGMDRPQRARGAPIASLSQPE
jgi:hypothetical protein